MTATLRPDEPITTLTQSTSCAAHRALLTRFWRRRCLACNVVITDDKWNRYCSDACGQRHRRMYWRNEARRAA